jgi:hypothetical protein
MTLAQGVFSLLMKNEDKDFEASRFDALFYQLEIQTLEGNVQKRTVLDLTRKVNALNKLGTIADVKKKKPFIDTLVNTDYIAKAGVPEWEKNPQGIAGFAEIDS